MKNTEDNRLKATECARGQPVSDHTPDHVQHAFYPVLPAEVHVYHGTLEIETPVQPVSDHVHTAGSRATRLLLFPSCRSHVDL